MSAVGT